MTAQDKTEFEAFCRGATDSQLAEIYRKEKAAGRRGFAAIALAETERRESC